MTEEHDEPLLAGAKGGERMASKGDAERRPGGGASAGDAGQKKPKHGSSKKSGTQ